jgi:hypothetical protein
VAEGIVLVSEREHKQIPGLMIAEPSAVFRGLTYGQWVAVWMNQLFSNEPEINYSETGGKGMVFLRGNLEGAYHEDDPQHAVYTSMTNDNRLRIQADTAVFIPIVNTMLSIDDVYQGQMMKNEITMRNVARKDTVNGGNIGARIKLSPSERSSALVDDLNEFYVESPLFPLSIDAKNPFIDIHEPPIEPGEYQTVSVGTYVIISRWPKKGLFRLSVFGKGVGTYLTRSVYDIEIIEGLHKLKDISKEAESTLPAIRDPMEFDPHWKSPPKWLEEKKETEKTIK